MQRNLSKVTANNVKYKIIKIKTYVRRKKNNYLAIS